MSSGDPEERSGMAAWEGEGDRGHVGDGIRGLATPASPPSGEVGFGYKKIRV